LFRIELRSIISVTNTNRTVIQMKRQVMYNIFDVFFYLVSSLIGRRTQNNKC